MRIHLLSPRSDAHVEYSISRSVPLGWAWRAASDGERFLCQDLSNDSGLNLSYRYVKIVSQTDIHQMDDILNGDQRDCWVIDASSETWQYTYFLTEQQCKLTAQVVCQANVVLANGQSITITPEHLKRGYGDWYMLYELPTPDYAECESGQIFQLFPYNRLELGYKDAPLSIILNPSMRRLFGTSTIAQVKPELVEFGGRSSSVTVTYSPRVPQGRACLHETLLLALGFEPGNRVRLIPTNKKLPFKERFSFLRKRSLVAVVQRATDFDIGYPTARLPQDSIDILGIMPGQEISILGQNAGAVRLRCLSKTDNSRADFEQTPHQREDRVIPGVELDLIRREFLNVEMGDPVIVRPAYGAIVIDEMTWLMNAVAIGAAAGIFTEHLWLTAANLATLSVLFTISFVRKFR